MAIGRGFVKSGSGYVSTPSTRAAARSAGTFGGEGFAGAQRAAANISANLSPARYGTPEYWRRKITSKQAALREAKRIGGAIRFVSGTSYKVITAKQAKTEAAAAAAKEAARLAAVKAKAEAESKAAVARLAAAKEAAAKEAAAKEAAAKTKATADCSKGLFYDAKWYLQCASGYVEYSLKGHNKCICVMELAKAKAQLDALYIKEDVAGNGDGVDGGFFSGLSGLGKIGDMLPLIIGGAIVVALLGMFKK